MSFNVASLLQAHVEETPTAPALSFPAKAYSDALPVWDTLTYREFGELSQAYANGFSANGVRRGDRVLMLMKPQLHLWPVLFALFRIGAVPVIMDPNMGRKRLMSCIEHVGCRVVIAEPIVHAIRTLFARRAFAKTEIAITVGRRWWWGGPTLASCLQPGNDVDVAPCEPTDLAAIAFTSGSTGTPKGVAYHHGMWDAEVKAIQQMFAVKPGDRSVQAFAAFAILDLCWGHHAIIPKMDLSRPATVDPEAFVTAIQQHRGQMVFASPIVWMKVQQYCANNGITLPSIDRAVTTGAPIPTWLLEAYSDILADGVEFHTPYGATEAIPVSHISSGTVLNETAALTNQGMGTCVGTPAPGVEVRILSVTDADLPEWSDDLLTDGIGEIAVRAPQVSREYIDRPLANQASKIACEDGSFYHRMGDLGRLDDQGRLWFCGRVKHRLQTAAGMIAPVPVEGVFNAHPRVFRTALVGVGEPGQEVPVLCVELHTLAASSPPGPGTQVDETLNRDLLALAESTRWAGLVQHILIHPGFPTDARHNSKIRRGDLKPWAEQQLKSSPLPQLSTTQETA